MTATKGKLAGVKVGDELLIRSANEKHGLSQEERDAWTPPRETVVRVARTYVYTLDKWTLHQKLPPGELGRREKAYSIETGQSRHYERRWAQTIEDYEVQKKVHAAYAYLEQAGVTVRGWKDGEVLELGAFVRSLKNRPDPATAAFLAAMGDDGSGDETASGY